MRTFIPVIFAVSIAFLPSFAAAAERSNIPPPPTPPPAEALPPAPLVSEEAPASAAPATLEESAATAADEVVEPLTPVTNPLPLLVVITLAILLIIGVGWFLWKRGGRFS